MEFKSTRRRFIELAGISATVSLAGCESLGTDGAPNSVQTDTGDGMAQVTVGIQPDQEELQQRQQEIQSDLRSGNITRTQARQQFQTAQRELLSDGIDQFKEQIGDDITVEDTVERAGALLVSGPAIRLIDTLAFDMVNGLFGAETFDEIQSQASTPTGTVTDGATATDSETSQN
jgi:hypothetical protein